MVKKTVNTNAVKEGAKKTAEVVKQAAKETTTVAKKAAKETAKTVKETAASVKKTAKKEYARQALKETYVQVNGNEYKQSEILEKVEASFIEAGHKLTALKNLQLYIKPEDNAAYYVVNGEITGKVDL